MRPAQMRTAHGCGGGRHYINTLGSPVPLGGRLCQENGDVCMGAGGCWVGGGKGAALVWLLAKEVIGRIGLVILV